MEKYPILNSFDRHKYSYTKSQEDLLNKKFQETKIDFPKIEGIILLEDPLNWEVSYQYILDIIFTNGELNKTVDYIDVARNTQHKLPIYVGASDFFSVSRAPWPRLAHGSFLVGLEAIYKVLSFLNCIYFLRK